MGALALRRAGREINVQQQTGPRRTAAQCVSCTVALVVGTHTALLASCFIPLPPVTDRAGRNSLRVAAVGEADILFVRSVRVDYPCREENDG